MSESQPKREMTEAERMVQEAMAEAQASLDEMKEVAEQEAEPGPGPAEEPVLSDAPPVSAPQSGIDLLNDVDLNVAIELGRTHMLVEDVLRLGEGSVVELDKLAGDPVDVYVNNCLVARGEVLVLNDSFCIRISEIIADLEEQAQRAVEEQAAG